MRNAGLALGDWGQGSAKSVEHLKLEIKEGESRIYASDKGEVQRLVDVVKIDVFHFSDNGDVYSLR